jgi:hypothetical protein
MGLPSRRAADRTPRGRTQKDGSAAGRRRRTRIWAVRPSRPMIRDRRAALSRVLALWPHEIDDCSAEGRQKLVGKLRCALRAERRRGVAGHWTYDLARHVELLHLYREELEMVRKQGRGPRDDVRLAIRKLK